MTSAIQSSPKTSMSNLPAYVIKRPDGVFIKLSPSPAKDILYLFVDRLFSNEALFSGLDYACFLNLLYGVNPVAAKGRNATEVRIASDIVRFPQQRMELYKGVKIISNGERAEYMFEPVYIEVVTDEPVYAESDDEGRHGHDGVAPVVEYVRKVDLQPTKLDFDEFVASMWLKGVRFGIDADTVRETIKRGITGRVDIAFQMDPTAGTDAEIIEESDTLRQDNAPLILRNGKADLRRAKNRFPQVAKNTVMLRKIPRALGEQGYLVTGETIEPDLPADIDMLQLAGAGTRIEQSAKGELLIANIDGFLCFDEGTGRIAITEKIENKGGVSARSTGDIKLDVEEYVEHGEVQEGRVVEGKHMTFRSDVFGTVISQNGNLQLGSNLAGGRAQSIGGNVAIKGRASNSTLEAWDGEVRAGMVESCTIIGKSVFIEQAVNCEIIAEELQLDIAEGCAIAGKSIRIASSNSRRHRETIITMLLPDIPGFDKQIAEATASLDKIKSALEARSREMAKASSDPGLAKYLAIRARIEDGSIKLTAEQQASWQKLVDKYAPLVKGSDVLMKNCLAFEEGIEKLIRERKASGDGVRCGIGEVMGDTVVKKQVCAAGIRAFHNLPAQELKARLQHLGNPQERIFSRDAGSFEWSFTVPEHQTTPT